MKKILFSILLIPILIYIVYLKFEFICSWLEGKPKDKGRKLKDFYRRIVRSGE